MKLHSTEQISKYHPDKYADQISDAILDAYLQQDCQSRVACEAMVKCNTVILAGEITSRANVNCSDVVQHVADKLHYKLDNCLSFISSQSPEIANGIKHGGAGDQGIMYGYACNDTPSMLPFGFDLANRIIAALEADTDNNPNTIFLGDAKCQVTVDLERKADIHSVEKILVSVCHKPGYSINSVRKRVKSLLSDLFDIDKIDIIINPAGLWTIGGPNADCGLTGRKIVCDQYGGYTPVGGGAFSGKDPSKVDRSGAYIARKIACDMVQTYELKSCGIQLAYAIGKADPISVRVICPEKKNAFQNFVTHQILQNYDLTPLGIIKALNLYNIKYESLAEGCHFRINGLNQQSAKVSREE